MPDTVIVNPEVQLAGMKSGERLVLTFRQDGVSGLDALARMAGTGQLRLRLPAQITLREVQQTRQWATDAQRTFRVKPTAGFDAARFIELLWSSLETASISSKASRYMRRSSSVPRARRRKPNRRSAKPDSI